MSNVSLIDGHLDNAEHYVCCGQVIPEGRQVCIICGKKVNRKQRQIDRIRNMNIKELANFLQQNHFNSWFQEEIIKWLESEVE